MRQILVNTEPALRIVPSGTVSLTKLACAVHWVLPAGGGVGGAFVAPGVRAGAVFSGGKVGRDESSVGVAASAVAALCVSCAWTVCATRVAMTDSLGAAPQALRMKATMQRKAIELNLCCTVIWVPFDRKDYNRIETFKIRAWHGRWKDEIKRQG